MKNSLIGKRCVVRVNKAGVFFGTVERITKQSITLSNYVRLWSWTGALCVEQIARCGVKSAKAAHGTLQVLDREEGGQVVVATDVAANVLSALQETVV